MFSTGILIIRNGGFGMEVNVQFKKRCSGVMLPFPDS